MADSKKIGGMKVNRGVLWPKMCKHERQWKWGNKGTEIGLNKMKSVYKRYMET